MLRIEAGLIFFNYEFSDQTDPFEAGIGFTVPLKSKSDDFVGRDALIRRQANPQKKLVGLEIDSNEAVGHGDCVHVGRAQIGVVTSAHALADPEEEHRARAPRCERGRRSAPKSRSASSTASRSGCRRASCASRTTIRRSSACGASDSTRTEGIVSLLNQIWTTSALAHRLVLPPLAKPA